VPRRPSFTRRWRTALGWPVGIGLTSWDYMWRTTPLHRSELLEQETESHMPPELPAGVDSSEVLRPQDGHGPLFHRRYSAEIREAQLTAAELLDALVSDLNQATPTMARFQKVFGADDGLRAGDEYVVRMPGPWDGPVRVVARESEWFRLATLEGHLEAGQIEFRVLDRGPDRLRFEIESWARSATRLSHVLYHRLRMAKEVQFHMWVSFLERTARLARGRVDDGVTVETIRVEAGAP
jgi:hypothetical protein